MVHALKLGRGMGGMHNPFLRSIFFERMIIIGARQDTRPLYRKRTYKSGTNAIIVPKKAA